MNWCRETGRCIGTSRQHARPGLREFLQLSMVVVQRNGIPQYDTIFVSGDSGWRYTGRQYHGAGSTGRVTIGHWRSVFGQEVLGALHRQGIFLAFRDTTAIKSMLVPQSEILSDGACGIILVGGISDVIAMCGAFHIGKE